MANYSPRITKDKRGHDVLHARRVLAPLSGLGTPIQVITSADFRPRLDASQFGAAARKAHKKRADEGASKGRIIHVAVGQATFAFLCVHVPEKGPIVCEAFASATSLTDAQATDLQLHLIDCAAELSHALGRDADRIAWATNDDGARKAIAVFGFGPAAKPDWCDRKHYLERPAPTRAGRGSRTSRAGGRAPR